MVRSWNQVKEADWKAMRTGAWITAALQRSKRIPPLRQFLEGDQGPEYTEDDLSKAREFHQSLVKREKRSDGD